MRLPVTAPRGEAWDRLFSPVQGLLREAAPRLSCLPSRTLEATAGLPDDPLVTMDGDGARLSSSLLEGAALTPADAGWAEAHPEVAGLALDRWRRAAGALLEAAVLAGLAERDPAGEPGGWWRVAVAAEAVDRAAPELGWLWPDLADLRLSGETGLVARPRAGAWLARWLRQTRAEDPARLATPGVDDAELARFGAWIRDPRGPAAEAPIPLPLGPPSADLRFGAAPWSFRALSLPVGPAGARASVAGAALSPPAGGPADQPLQTIAASVLGGEIEIALRPAGPVGTWALNTGVVSERLGAARGIELELRADGRLEILLADAFMGLPTAEMVELAESVGVSGWASGRWTVTAVEPDATPELDAGELHLLNVTPRGLTLHPRGGHAFAVPAASVIRPAEQILSGLSGARLRWQRAGDGLVLSGRVMGVSVELRFGRP